MGCGLIVLTYCTWRLNNMGIISFIRKRKKQQIRPVFTDEDFRKWGHMWDPSKGTKEYNTDFSDFKLTHKNE